MDAQKPVGLIRATISCWNSEVQLKKDIRASNLVLHSSDGEVGYTKLVLFRKFYQHTRFRMWNRE